MNQTGNTQLTQRDRYKNSQIAHDRFPPCGNMTYLITRLREQGFKVQGKLLDVGCGQGRFCRYMVQLAGIKEALGIDESKDAINVANTRIPGRAQEKIQFQISGVIDFLKGNRGKVKYDIIGAFNLLEYMEDPQDTVKRLIATLKTGSFLVGSVYVGNALPYSKHQWEDVKAFFKEFPELTPVDMKDGNTGCAVFIFNKVKKTSGRKRKVEK